MEQKLLQDCRKKLLNSNLPTCILNFVWDLHEHVFSIEPNMDWNDEILGLYWNWDILVRIDENSVAVSDFTSGRQEFKFFEDFSQAKTWIETKLQ